MKKLFLHLLAILVLGCAGGVRAEDWGLTYVGVLDPANGRLLGHYMLDEIGERQIKEGQAVPTFAELKTFAIGPKPVDHSKPVGLDLGRLPSGEKLVILGEPKGKMWEPTTGSLGVIGKNGKFRELQPGITFQGAGRSLFFHNPRLIVAGPYLLAKTDKGTQCRLLSNGKTVWEQSWRMPYFRWCWGAWFQGGELYVNTMQGLSKIEPSTGRPLWHYTEPGEVTDTRLGSDGLLYVSYVYPDHSTNEQLSLTAAKKYGWPFEKRDNPDALRHYDHIFEFSTYIVPYRTGWFGVTFKPSTSQDESEQFDWGKTEGRVAVWETVGDRWNFIFDYNPAQYDSPAKLDKLFSRHRLSPEMRSRLLRSKYLGPR